MSKDKKKKEKRRKIRFAHDAWWFIHNHPAFRLRWRYLVDDEYDNNKRRHIIESKDGVKYIEDRHFHRRAIEDIGSNIFYVHVNKHGTTDDDDVNRKYPEVWLEFGPISYIADSEIESNRIRKIEAKKRGYEYWETPITPEMYVNIQHSHDWRLDCGAPTFDEALVKLANNVLKYYGDYKDDEDEMLTCGGKEVCLDCAYLSEWKKKHGLIRKDEE